MALTITISTPLKEFQLPDVQYLVVQSHLGEMAIYPSHAPLMALLEKGVARVHTISKTERWELSEGILEVLGEGDQVVLIVESAERLKAGSSSSIS